MRETMPYTKNQTTRIIESAKKDGNVVPSVFGDVFFEMHGDREARVFWPKRLGSVHHEAFDCGPPKVIRGDQVRNQIDAVIEKAVEADARLREAAKERRDSREARRAYFESRRDCPLRSRVVGVGDDHSEILLVMEPSGERGAKVYAKLFYTRLSRFYAFPEYGVDREFDNVQDAEEYFEGIPSGIDLRTPDLRL
jgi:hypothetical protein